MKGRDPQTLLKSRVYCVWWNVGWEIGREGRGGAGWWGWGLVEELDGERCGGGVGLGGGGQSLSITHSLFFSHLPSNPTNRLGSVVRRRVRQQVG